MTDQKDRCKWDFCFDLVVSSGYYLVLFPLVLAGVLMLAVSFMVPMFTKSVELFSTFITWNVSFFCSSLNKSCERGGS